MSTSSSSARYHLTPTEAVLGASLGRLGALLERFRAVLEPSWESLGRSWGPFGPTWGPLGALLGCLGAILEASWAVLGGWKPKQARTSTYLKHQKGTSMVLASSDSPGGRLGALLGRLEAVLGAS